MKIELEQSVLKETIAGEKYGDRIFAEDESSGDDEVYVESNVWFEMEDVPLYDIAEERLVWLRSQIIGSNAEFDSPFGTRRLIYADHTATAPSLLYFENFIVSHILPFYGNTHTYDSYVGQHTTKVVKEAAKFIKKSLGGGEDDAVVFSGSGSTSAIKRLQEVMGIAVTSIVRERVIETLKEEERWVVLVGPYEHHSNLRSWRQSVAEVVEIGMDEHGLLDIKALTRQLEAYTKLGNTRPILGSFSACSNVTGIYSDTRAIAKLLHHFGAFACFDFAASGPYVEIDMRSGEMDGYDAIFLSPHKFLGGPGSPGILLMNKSLYMLKSCPPSTCGGGTVSYVNGFNDKDTLYLDEIEERESGGTPDIIGIIRASLAFWGYDGIKPGWTRVSFSYYLPNEEFEFILTALEFIAVYGQRFLPLYAFNVRTGSWTLKKKALTDLLRKGNYRNGHHIIALKQQYPDSDAKLAAILSKHTVYLESAKAIANLLPKFPPENKLHEDVQFSLLHFRI